MLRHAAEPKEQRFRRCSYSEIAAVRLGALGRYAWHPQPRQRAGPRPGGVRRGLCFFFAPIMPIDLPAFPAEQRLRPRFKS